MTRALPYLIAYAVALLIYGIAWTIRGWLTDPAVPAPNSGFDRAGGPYNGHPARVARQREGAAATAGILLARDGNGANHGSASAIVQE